MVDILRHTLGRRDFLRAAGLAAGAATLAACTPGNPEVSTSNQQTGAELLAARGIDPNTIALVPIIDRPSKYEAVSTITSTDVPSQLREVVESLGFGGSILEVNPEDLATFPKEKQEAVIKGFEEKGMGDMLMAGGIMLGGLDLLGKKDTWAAEFITHLGNRRNEEFQECVDGKRKGVGHRKWLTMVILASAAGALMGNEGINGVTMQLVGTAPNSDTLRMLFSVPQSTLDTFLRMAGTSRADMLLTDLVADKAGNFILKMMVERGGTGTAFFLTPDRSNLFDEIRAVKYGVSQFGKLVENDGTLSNYVATLAGLRALWGQAKRIMRADYKTICNIIGKEKVVTPAAPTEVPATSTPVPMGEIDLEGILAAMGDYRRQDGEVVDLFQAPGATIKMDGSFMSIPFGDKIAAIDMSPVINTKP